MGDVVGLVEMAQEVSTGRKRRSAQDGERGFTVEDWLDKLVG
jgi:signal recognition particle GTPase